MGTQLTTAEVARRLGVKPETVYAYVSRGLLRSERNADGRGSRFDRADVEALAALGRRGARARDTITVQTGITLIDRGRLFYRGRDACELAGAEPFEAVVGLLWTSELTPVVMTAPADLVALGEAVTAPLPTAARLADRLRLIVAATAAADPFRFDTSPAAVVDTGRSMLATMVEALPHRSAVPPSRPDPAATSRPDGSAASLTERLWRRLTPATPTAAGIAALNGALVLLADHDLAASTLAARVAASTRAHPYAVVGAGLAALDGPLHGAASRAAFQMLTEATTGDPIRALADHLRAGGAVAGFGHPLYPDGDPRATTLLALLAAIPGADQARTAVDALAAAAVRRSGPAPNIDFALAALALLTGMGPDAGETIFAIARTAGWLTHALEEYADRPGRFRPSGRYEGPIPAGSRASSRSAEIHTA